MVIAIEKSRCIFRNILALMGGRWVKIGIIGALLVLHFSTRLYVYHTAELASGKPAFYPDSFNPAFAMLGGNGFKHLGLEEEEAIPIKEFIQLKRAEVTPAELEKFFQSSYKTYPPERSWRYQHRTLEIYVAAGLWKLFGAKWVVFFVFYSMVSALASLMIFYIVRRISGSYWCGLLAAFLFFASPMENHFFLYSVRNTNPLWFTIFAFAFLFCVAGRFESKIANYLSYYGLGFVSLLGLGWRIDARGLTPVILLGFLALLIKRKHGLRHLAFGVLLFLAGTYSIQALIWKIGPERRYPANFGFHVAYYGEHARSNQFKFENSFQILKHDALTINTAKLWHTFHDQPGSTEKWRYPNAAYSQTCKEIYLELFKYNVFNYYSHFPEYYAKVIRSYLSYKADYRMPFLQPLYAISDYIISKLYIFYLIGIIGIWFIEKRKVEAGILFLYSFYYSATLLLVLPSIRHEMPMVLPKSIFAALGIYYLIILIPQFKTWKKSLTGLGQKLKNISVASLILGLLWGTGYLATKVYSTRVRDGYINEIEKMAKKGGIDAPETIKEEGKVFSVTFTPHDSVQGQVVGYLLKLKTDGRQLDFECRHLRPCPMPRDRPTETKYIDYLYFTHRLASDQEEQYFFVSCIPVKYDYWSRNYTCFLELPAGAEIISSTRVDISKWGRLPFTSVFYENQRSAGSQSLRDAKGYATNKERKPYRSQEMCQ